MEKMNATYFKARCLAILDRVLETGERIVILKRGRPVAELWPPSGAESRSPQSELQGTVTVVGDIVGPALPEHHWESLAGSDASPDPAADDETPDERVGWVGGE